MEAYTSTLGLLTFKLWIAHAVSNIDILCTQLVYLSFKRKESLDELVFVDEREDDVLELLVLEHHALHQDQLLINKIINQGCIAYFRKLSREEMERENKRGGVG